MANITSDYWGIVLAGTAPEPKVIRASEFERNRIKYPPDTTWIPGFDLKDELQNNPYLEKFEDAIDDAVWNFKRATGSSVKAPPLKNAESREILMALIGDVLGQNTLASRLIRFALSDRDLNIYLIQDNDVHAYYPNIDKILEKNPDAAKDYMGGFCDDRMGHDAVYVAINSVKSIVQNSDALALDFTKLCKFDAKNGTNLNSIKWTLCEELLHHAMKRLYRNECEIFPRDNSSRRVVLEKTIRRDLRLARDQVRSQVEDDETGDIDKKMDREDEAVRQRFRQDLNFVEEIYKSWEHIYFEFPVKVLTMQALDIWEDPQYNKEERLPGETRASRYPNLEQYVTAIIGNDLATFEKTGALPSLIPKLAPLSAPNSGKVVPISTTLTKEKIMSNTRRNHSNTQRQRLDIIRNTTDFSKLMTPDTKDLRNVITNSYWPLTQALIARDTTSSNNKKINRSTAGKVRNMGIEEPGMANQIARAAMDLGIETHIIPIEDEAIREKYGEHSIVICRVGPQKDGGILLTGHTDAVPVQLKIARDPETKQWVKQQNLLLATPEGDKIYGRGMIDMKGTDAAILTTLGLMKQHEKDLKQPFYAVFTPGEETWVGGAEKAREEMDRLGYRPELVIIPEAYHQHIIMTGHAGYASMDIIPSGAPNSNAEIRAAAEWIIRMDNLADTISKDKAWHAAPAFTPPHPTLNYYLYTTPKHFAGTNTVPAEAALDITAGANTDIHALKAIEQRLNDKIKKHAATLIHDGLDEKALASLRAVQVTLTPTGANRYQLHIKGHKAHSSIPHLGINANKYWAEAVQALGGMQDISFSLPSELYENNVKLGISYRCHYEDQVQKISAAIKEAAHDGFTMHGLDQPETPMIDNSPPMPYIQKNAEAPAMRKFVDVVSDVIGEPANVYPGLGAGDGSYWWKLAGGSIPTGYWSPHAEDTHHASYEFATNKDYVNSFKGLLGISAKICGADALEALAKQNVTLSEKDLQPLTSPPVPRAMEMA